jgi:hypothetical protein
MYRFVLNLSLLKFEIKRDCQCFTKALDGTVRLIFIKIDYLYF